MATLLKADVLGVRTKVGELYCKVQGGSGRLAKCRGAYIGNSMLCMDTYATQVVGTGSSSLTT